MENLDAVLAKIAEAKTLVELRAIVEDLPPDVRNGKQVAGAVYLATKRLVEK